MIVVILSCLSSGCAKKYWAHSGKSTQEFYRDSARCEAMSYSGGSSQMMTGGDHFAQGWNQAAAIDSSFASGRIYERCMMGEGWYLTKNN